MDLKQRNLEMKAFFNEKADGYDSVHLSMMANKTAITEVLPNGTARLLDLGGGTGLELIPLFVRFPTAHVTVVDISELMLEQLRAREFATHVTCIAGDFFTIDFGANYDAVISSAALHHFAPEDKRTLYAKIFFALRPGGLLVNSDRFAETDEEQAACFAMLADPAVNMRHIDTPLTSGCEIALLREVGFADVVVTPLEDSRYRLLVARKL